jgi:hypothetical protein
MTCRVKVVYHEALSGKRIRCGAVFPGVPEAQRRWLVVNLFGDPATWDRAHDARVRSPLLMAGHLFAGLWRSIRSPLTRRRRIPRRRCMIPVRIQAGHVLRWGVLRDQSSRGVGLLLFGLPAQSDSVWLVGNAGGQFTPVYAQRRWLWIWRVGLRPSVPSDCSVSQK